MSKKNYTFILMIIFIIAACNSEKMGIENTLSSITVDDMKNHIATLASDEFMARAPATIGEEKTINYI